MSNTIVYRGELTSMPSEADSPTPESTLSSSVRTVLSVRNLVMVCAGAWPGPALLSLERKLLSSLFSAQPPEHWSVCSDFSSLLPCIGRGVAVTTVVRRTIDAQENAATVVHTTRDGYPGSIISSLTDRPRPVVSGPVIRAEYARCIQQRQ